MSPPPHAAGGGEHRSLSTKSLETGKSMCFHGFITRYVPPLVLSYTSVFVKVFDTVRVGLWGRLSVENTAQ